MIWSDYWGALSARQRFGILAGVALILGLAISSTVWLLRDPYVPVASGLTAEDVNETVQALERAALDYRVSDRGDAVSVRRSQLGKARTASADESSDVSASVGLELFKETDFSSTDFAQRINYQRALQGELTRTIRTIVGVRSARVHVILPDTGLFKRNAAKASAAVSVALDSGLQLTRTQVRGIQRLVAASVPEIKLEDIVVLDEFGTSLTRAGGETEGDLSSAQLDLKRQADQYLESKLSRLLADLVPHGAAALSVDTTLDYQQLRVTTEEPIAARGPNKESGHAVGVLVKERQSRRGQAAGVIQTDGYQADADSTDWEYEYKVGNRVAQTLSAPGSIKRISVAVALQGASSELSRTGIEDLVAHAVGIDRSRGDSIAVLLLSPSIEGGTDEPVIERASPANSDSAHRSQAKNAEELTRRKWIVFLAILVGVGLAAILWRAWMRMRGITAADTVDEEAVTAKVRQWLSEGASHGAR